MLDPKAADDKFLDEAMDDLKRAFIIEQHVRARRSLYWSSKFMFAFFILMVILERFQPSLDRVLLVAIFGVVAAFIVITENKTRSDLLLLKTIDRLKSRRDESPTAVDESGAKQPPG